MAKKKKNGRKIMISVMLHSDEIKWLDRKVQKGVEERSSRCAIIRYLVRYAMEKTLLK